MKIKYCIEKIEQQDLSNLFSTAIFGSEWLGSEVDDYKYQEDFINADKCDCYEDQLAVALLSGGKIILKDYYAEDKTDKYGSVKSEWDEDDLCMRYEITLKDVKNGLEKALEDSEYSQDCVLNLANNPCNLDISEAEVICQYIMFGENIYG